MSNESLRVWADRWMADKKIGRGLSANSEAAYRRDLGLVAQLMCDREVTREEALAALVPADLTEPRFKAAMVEYHDCGPAPASRSRVLGVWKDFLGWLVRRGLLTHDPSVEVRHPKAQDKPPVALTDEELSHLVATLRTPDPSARWPWPQRDVALLSVLAGAGVRASELCGLVMRDVHYVGGEPMLRVHGKGSKTRVIPISPHVVTVLEEYLRSRWQRHPNDAVRDPHPDDAWAGECWPPAAPLFTLQAAPGTPQDRPLTRSALQQMVVRWFTRSAVPSPEGELVHTFRHTYAMGLLSRGVAIHEVQKLLGHASLTSTQVYARATGQDLHQAARAAPIASMI